MQHGLGLVAEAAAAAAAATAAWQALAANRSSVNALRARGDSLEALWDSLEAQIAQLALQLDGCRLEQTDRQTAAKERQPPKPKQSTRELPRADLKAMGHIFPLKRRLAFN